MNALNPLDVVLLLGVACPLLPAIVWTAERKGCFRIDTFPSDAFLRSGLALFTFVLVLTTLMPAAALGRRIDPGKLTLPRLLALQAVLLLFLLVWWLLSARPPLRSFLCLTGPHPLQQAGVGVVVGLAGWGLTVATGALLVLVTRAFHLPTPGGLTPLVAGLARLPAIERLAIVAAAMTVEEFYFRSFLQRRLGAFPAAALFLVAHAGYGDPLFFVGLLAITAVLTLSFARTGSAIAAIAAHGTFDAIQLLLVLPAAVRAGG